ncbi:phosphatase PAP2 family protein [Mycolicibacterium sp. YH-1]|uniref:phosphatase PAP2 family protein n=1 Tax=Mycolicibacterium sp. YH-1 TaxID=2908837 RepID=UPI001F4C340B|nr:phosphatase PAP2 family protein [Mycolicibacterium sp. YH-1]UNB49842.1 phosphatase PAP2 family protein [Mycolicibacterium sp. YH-1]
MTDRACTPRACSVAALLASLLLGLALIAHHAVAGTALDHAVLGWMVHHRSPALTSWAIAVTDVGSPVGIGVLAIAVSAVLWWRRGSPWPAVVVLATVAASAAISTATKVVVGAHRPVQTLQLVLETDPSFPSGHVTGTLALLGALTVVTARHVGPAARAALITATVVGTAVVASTRLYLGVHWLSDVLGGVLLGATAVVLAHIALRLVTASRTRQSTSATPADAEQSSTAPARLGR